MTDLNTIKDFTAALRATETGTKAYDTAAEVIRVDGSTAWVHIPGGVDETPAQLTIDAKPGDTVNVRVSGGRAWITGNGTRPPTDDARAITADNHAIAAEETATEAVEVAEQAAKSAAATRQYFWHDEDGAHVSTVENDGESGPNVLITSDGLYIRVDSSDRAYFLSDGMRIYGDDTASTEIAHLGYGESNSGSALNPQPAPYYSLGKRLHATDEFVYGTTYSAGDLVIYNEQEYLCTGTTGTRPDSEIGYLYWQLIAGNYSMAEGDQTIAGGWASHAEGYQTKAIKESAHAEGSGTIASGLCAHAEGLSTQARGTYSHTEGRDTVATHFCAHAAGYGTVAGASYQTVIGKFNDNNTNNAFEIGWGGSETNRANIFEVDSDGNVTAAGDFNGVMKTTNGVVTDLDEALENGFYRYGNTAENRPNAAGGSLMVLHWSDAYTYQIACPNNAAGNAVLYTRIKTSTGWGDWTRNIGQQDITHYVHEQAVSSDTWTIDHNLGYFPSVTVVDSAGNVVKGETEYTSANQVVLSFAGSFAGKAYLN